MKKLLTLAVVIAIGVYGIASPQIVNGGGDKNRKNGTDAQQKSIIIIDTDYPNYGYPGYGSSGIVIYYPPSYGYPNQGYTPTYPSFPGNGYPGNYFGVSDGLMSQFLQTLNQQGFDNNKLEMAKIFANANWLTAQQIYQIMTLFAFENNKLEFAKSAYTNCIDKGNYFMVTNAFSFSSSTTNLMKFIGNSY